MRRAFLFIWLASTAGAQTTAIVGGTIHTVGGAVIEGGTVLVVDGRIFQVGQSLEIPDGARRIDARGKVVTPGLIDAATAVGLVEVASLADTRDASADLEDPIRADFRVSDGLNPHSIVIPETRLGGVTTVASLPSGGIVSGQAAAIDLLGARASEMIVRDGAAMLASFDPAASEAAGGARGALSRRLRAAFADARFLDANRDAHARGALRDLAAGRLDLEALSEAMRAGTRFVFRASRAADIDQALALAEDHDLEIAILGAEEAWRRRRDLADAGVPVIVKPYGNLPLQFDRLGTRFDNAALLEGASVSVVLSTMTTHNARNLRFEAGQAVRHGMSWTGALRAVTLAPAELLGIAETHGSLEPGKTANVVVWSGDPFEPAAAAEHVLIRGQEIDADSRQRRLLERYRNLDGSRVQYLANEPR